MKPNIIIISFVFVAVLSTSCSRQVTSLNTTGRLETGLALQSDPVNTTHIRNLNHEERIDPAFVPVSDINGSIQQKNSSLLKIRYAALVKKEAGKMKALVVQHKNDFAYSEKHIAERGYPQINKAGFILIAGGVLGFLLHLIAVACIVLIVLGVFILVSPLFRKRY